MGTVSVTMAGAEGEVIDAEVAVGIGRGPATVPLMLNSTPACGWSAGTVSSVLAVLVDQDRTRVQRVGERAGHVLTGAGGLMG